VVSVRIGTVYKHAGISACNKLIMVSNCLIVGGSSMTLRLFSLNWLKIPVRRQNIDVLDMLELDTQIALGTPKVEM